MRMEIHMTIFSLQPFVTNEDGHAEFMRAVVIITEETKKGTARHP